MLQATALYVATSHKFAKVNALVHLLFVVTIGSTFENVCLLQVYRHQCCLSFHMHVCVCVCVCELVCVCVCVCACVCKYDIVCACVSVCVMSACFSLHTCQSLAQSITLRPYGDPPRGNLSTAAIAALEDTWTQTDTDTRTEADTETATQVLARSHTHTCIFAIKLVA